jgi:hypothetical protein
VDPFQWALFQWALFQWDGAFGVPREDDKDASAAARGKPLRRLRATRLSPARLGLARVFALLRQAWWLAKPLLRNTLQILLALIIVFEEWGWQPLADWLGRQARWSPWAKLEYAIARLPPYAALLAFALPTLVLLPLKFLALALIGSGQLLLASLLFIAAKVVATALIARLFTVTQPALMQIGWFAWSYDTVMPWKEAVTDRVRGSWPWRLGRLWKERGRRLLAAQWRRLAPSRRSARALMLAGTAQLRRRLRIAVLWMREEIKRRLATTL